MIPMSVGERICKVRKTLSLTQEEFALRLGINKGSPSNLEKGRQIPSEQLIKLISHEFLVSEEWLKNGQGEMFTPPEQTIEETIEKAAPYISRTALKNVLQKAIKEHCLLTDDHLSDYHPDVAQIKTGNLELDHMISLLIKLWSLGDEKLKAWASIQFKRAFPEDIVDEVEKRHKNK